MSRITLLTLSALEQSAFTFHIYIYLNIADAFIQRDSKKERKKTMKNSLCSVGSEKRCTPIIA